MSNLRNGHVSLSILGVKGFILDIVPLLDCVYHTLDTFFPTVISQDREHRHRMKTYCVQKLSLSLYARLVLYTNI